MSSAGAGAESVTLPVSFRFIDKILSNNEEL